MKRVITASKQTKKHWIDEEGMYKAVKEKLPAKWRDLVDIDIEIGNYRPSKFDRPERFDEYSDPKDPRKLVVVTVTAPDGYGFKQKRSGALEKSYTAGADVPMDREIPNSEDVELQGIFEYLDLVREDDAELLRDRAEYERLSIRLKKAAYQSALSFGIQLKKAVLTGDRYELPDFGKFSAQITVARASAPDGHMWEAGPGYTLLLDGQHAAGLYGQGSPSWFMVWNGSLDDMESAVYQATEKYRDKLDQAYDSLVQEGSI